MRGEVQLGDGLWRQVEVRGPLEGRWPELMAAGGLPAGVVTLALGCILLFFPLAPFTVHSTEYRLVDGHAELLRSRTLGEGLTYRAARRLRRAALHPRRAQPRVVPVDRPVAGPST